MFSNTAAFPESHSNSVQPVAVIKIISCKREICLTLCNSGSLSLKKKELFFFKLLGSTCCLFCSAHRHASCPCSLWRTLMHPPHCHRCWPLNRVLTVRWLALYLFSSVDAASMIMKKIYQTTGQLFTSLQPILTHQYLPLLFSRAHFH